MILWTIQHQAAYEQMRKNGELTANENHLFCEDDLRFAYDWMAEQMADRIGPAPGGIHYPVWAWYLWEGKRKRLDMRTHRRWTTPGTPIVLLTVGVPDDQVLLSDFDLWHITLNNGSCYDDEPDWDQDDSEQEKRESWNRIFVSAEDEKQLIQDRKTIQATVWQIKNEWVIRAEPFVSG